MREIVYDTAPRFYRDEAGTVMFVYRLDAATEIGPRPATALDKLKHGAAYEAFAMSDDAETAPRRKVKA